MAQPFIYTNPAAAQQAIAFEQLRAAAKETAAKNDAAFTQSMINAGSRDKELRASREDRATSREFQSKENDKLNALTAEDQRLRRESDSARTAYLKNKEIDADTKSRGALRFDAIQERIESNDPPTATELAQELDLHKDVITPEMAEILKRRNQNKITVMNESANTGDTFAKQWNARMKAIQKGETPEQIVAEFNKSPQKNYIIYDPDSGQFKSMFRRPRVDAPAGVSSFEDIRANALKRAGAPGGRAFGESGIPFALGRMPREIGNEVPINMDQLGVSSFNVPDPMDGWRSLPSRIAAQPTQEDARIEMDPRLDEVLKQFEFRRSPAFAVPESELEQIYLQKDFGPRTPAFAVPPPRFAPPAPLGVPYGMEFAPYR